MKIVLENVNRKHLEWLQKMAETLQFKVKEIEITEAEEDAALARAIDAEREDEILSPEESERFIESLG